MALAGEEEQEPIVEPGFVPPDDHRSAAAAHADALLEHERKDSDRADDEDEQDEDEREKEPVEESLPEREQVRPPEDCLYGDAGDTGAGVFLLQFLAEIDDALDQGCPGLGIEGNDGG